VLVESHGCIAPIRLSLASRERYHLVGSGAALERPADFEHGQPPRQLQPAAPRFNRRFRTLQDTLPEDLMAEIFTTDLKKR